MREGKIKRKYNPAGRERKEEPVTQSAPNSVINVTYSLGHLT